jgi:dihydropteroate synthase
LFTSFAAIPRPLRLRGDPYTSNVAAPSLLLRGEPRTLDKTLVMGIINASPESFSDAGMYRTLNDQIDLAARAVEAGADMLDIGGQSAITREPEVDPSVELDRVGPLITAIHEKFPHIPISVDTYKPSVAAGALTAGASIVNDVSGLRYPELATICAETNAALVIMHTRARPKVRLQDPQRYDDVVKDVVTFLRQKIDVAVTRGVPFESIIVDPGPDFSKTPHQTITVLRHLDEICSLERPLLLALSRKDFLGAIVQKSPIRRDAATLAAIAYFAARPGNIVRVHDVAATVDAIKTVDALTGRHDIPADYLLPDELRHEPAARHRSRERP